MIRIVALIILLILFFLLFDCASVGTADLISDLKVNSLRTTQLSGTRA